MRGPGPRLHAEFVRLRRAAEPVSISGGASGGGVMASRCHAGMVVLWYESASTGNCQATLGVESCSTTWSSWRRPRRYRRLAGACVSPLPGVALGAVAVNDAGGDHLNRTGARAGGRLTAAAHGQAAEDPSRKGSGGTAVERQAPWFTVGRLTGSQEAADHPDRTPRVHRPRYRLGAAPRSPPAGSSVALSSVGAGPSTRSGG